MAGGVIDASVGGASFSLAPLSAPLVSVPSGVAIAGKSSRLGHKLGGKDSVSKRRSLQFAFVLLDRAVLHWHQVAGRAHARRDELLIDTAQKRVHCHPTEERHTQDTDQATDNHSRPR